MQAIRLHALLDPKNSPSWWTRYRDIATASSSVTLGENTHAVKSAFSRGTPLLHSPERLIDDRKGQLEIVRETIDTAVSQDLQLPEPSTSSATWVDSHVHALYNSIDLVPPLCTFRLLAVEHDTIFHLVEQAAAFGIRESDDNIFFLVPEVLTRPGNGATSTSARDKRVDETASLPPDLWPCSVQVGVVVASVLERW